MVSLGLGVGVLPFGSIFIEMYFVFTSFWNYKFYYVYGFMFLGTPPCAPCHSTLPCAPCHSTPPCAPCQASVPSSPCMGTSLVLYSTTLRLLLFSSVPSPVIMLAPHAHDTLIPLAVAAMLVIVCACVAVVVTYFLLNAEDYNWQWPSFLCVSSTAIYVYLYGVTTHTGTGHSPLSCTHPHCLPSLVISF